MVALDYENGGIRHVEFSILAQDADVCMAIHLITP
jgi:hypothetical protein